MPPPSSSPPRRSRWQLSLRMLLILTALVGVGLTVYRWPWVVITSRDVMSPAGLVIDPFVRTHGPPPVAQKPKGLYREEQRTTYRRNWRAKWVKNGVEQVYRDGKLWHESHYQDGELHGIRRAYSSNADVIYQVTYQHGLLHGPAWHRPAPEVLMWKGEFVQNEPHGPWEIIVDHGWRMDESHPAPWVRMDFPETTWRPKSSHSTLSSISIQSDWDHGKPNGAWTWKTVDEGVTIRKAEYRQGEVVNQDDVPIVAQFKERLVQLASDPGVKETLRILQGPPIQDRRFGLLRSFASTHGYCIQIERLDAATETLFIHGLNLSQDSRLRGDNLLTSIGEMAAESNHRLDFRYGGLLFVKGTDAQAFLDPTGIENIKFSPGSSQKRDWTEVIDVLSSSQWGKGCLQELLRNTSISCVVEKATALRDPDAALDGQLLFRRRRCDVIGLVCYLTGLRCEQRDNELTFTHHPDRTADQAMSQPLLPPEFLEPRTFD